MKIKFSAQISEKCSNIKFHENPSSGRPSFSMRTDGQAVGQADGRKDVTKVIVAFGKFAKNASFLRIMKENTSKAVSIAKSGVFVVCALSFVI
jgi:hypothetical protein